MNLHEYQAKRLLAAHGVPVPKEFPGKSVAEIRSIADRLFQEGAGALVVKAQIHAGGRGKGTFKNGLQGGVHLCRSAEEAEEKAQAMLGETLVTRQTGAEGKQVNVLLVAVAETIVKEFYLAVLLDRARELPVVMASAEGGMDIEEVAEKSPGSIYRTHVDPAWGLLPFQARKMAVWLGLPPQLLRQAEKLLHHVYRTWWESDASLIEINPLCLTKSGAGKPAVVALDAKISLDDNALYRQPDLAGLRDPSEEEPLEIEATRHHLNYIKLDGNIACLVNGAGLAMAAMDIIKHYGGNPANFLDVGGGASQEQVAAAFRIILSDANVKGILINIFGGIMQCDVIAQGIISAVRDTELNLPLVVRLEGNNVHLGNELLSQSGLDIIRSDSMADAAQKIIAAAGQAA